MFCGSWIQHCAEIRILGPAFAEIRTLGPAFAAIRILDQAFAAIQIPGLYSRYVGTYLPVNIFIFSIFISTFF